jgi:hypothetical protein
MKAGALSCEVAAQPEIPPAPGSQVAVLKGMLEMAPFGFSPVVEVMESVAAAPGLLADPSVTGAVILLSDGGDNCTGATQPEMVSRLGEAAGSLAAAGVRTYAVRYGSESGETPEQAEQLSAVAMHGGTTAGSATPYLDAKSDAELIAALVEISDRLATCAFALNDIPAGVDKSRANLFLNGDAIGYDSMGAKQEGWNWTDTELTSVELYGTACNAFKTNRVTRVVIEFGCEPVLVGPD